MPPSRIVIPAIADDGSLYPIEKMEAHRRGVFHLAVSVFVFSEGRLLIQQRAAGKYHCGLQWANSCCTHPNWGETVAAAGQRRLGEELGLHLPLRAAGVIEYAAPVSGDMREHERVHVFQANATGTELKPNADAAEVQDLRWAAPEALQAEVAATPDKFAPWFLIYLRRWDDLGFGH